MNNLIFLHCGNWDAAVSPSQGGNVVLQQYSRQSVLAPQGLFRDPYLVGAPILLPANRTSHGTFRFQGAAYHLPINEPMWDNHLHGLIHDAEFTVLRQSPHAVSLALVNDGSFYPFPFRLVVNYALSDIGFSAIYTLENTSSQDMPVVFGLHTTFLAQSPVRIPLGQAQIRDPRCIPTGELRPLTPQEQSLVKGCAIQETPISGFYTAAGHTARIGNYFYQVSQNFDHWVLYNAGGHSGILCVEPQCGAVNGLNSGAYHRIPGHSSLVLKTEILRVPDFTDFSIL